MAPRAMYLVCFALPWLCLGGDRLSLGAPIVTVPSQQSLQSRRVVAGALRLMEVPELIVPSAEAMVEYAVEVATNASLRHGVRIYGQINAVPFQGYLPVWQLQHKLKQRAAALSWEQNIDEEEGNDDTVSPGHCHSLCFPFPFNIIHPPCFAAHALLEFAFRCPT